MMASSLTYKSHQYGKDNDLQKVGVWEVDSSRTLQVGYWVIYVHGGAWRDPRIEHRSFTPTIDKILALQDPSKSSIVGFASIDYRLSPHPTFPQDPTETPTKEYRNASHPDHINDVWSALGFLQKQYASSSSYVLIGHSAGATLALQLLMGSTALKGAAVPPGTNLPTAIIGMEGIYDLLGLVDRLGPPYAELFVGAFGDSSNWSDASPMKFTQGFEANWKGGKLAVLGWSLDDELIDKPEIEGMAKVLEQDGVKTLVFESLQGTHDGMWEDGRVFAEIIIKTLEELSK
ncbi:Alpha/Beta hydrolase protein [Xylariales sp. AK1849]|nr:Alpha/Beta hydrolase protein [Xylariales sp. AK1849]